MARAHSRMMAAPMFIGLRRSIALALIVALTLAGLGRALAAVADPAPVGALIGGAIAPICHSGAGEAPSDPGQPAGHDCCDSCALLAPAVLPAPPGLARPAPAARYADHARAVPWAPVLTRPRDPRLSRGPPAV